MLNHMKPALVVLGLGLPLAGCLEMPMPASATKALPQDAGPTAQEYATAKDLLEGALPALSVAMSDPAFQITGLGYSQISNQPGKTLNQKRLLAIRAAKLEAIRDLTEQVHGLQLTATTSVRDAVLRDDQLQATVEGIIRGARTLHIKPKDSDTFEVVMALDTDTLAYIVRAARGTL